MKKRIKIQGLTVLAALIVLAFFSRYLLADSRSVYLNALGILVLLLGYFFRIAGRGLKAELNPDGKTLITAGVYSLTRNPMYFGTLLIGAGVILALFRWWVMAVFVAVYLWIYIPQMNKEALALSERFGEDFKGYCRATPRFLPTLKSMFRTSPAEYLKIKPRWIRKEIVSLILTVGFILAIILGRIIIAGEVAGKG